MVLRKKKQPDKKKNGRPGYDFQGIGGKTSTMACRVFGRSSGLGFEPNKTHRNSMGLVDVPTNLHSFTIKD